MNQPTLFESTAESEKIDEILLYALGEFQSRGFVVSERELPLDRHLGAFKRAAEHFKDSELTDEQIARQLAQQLNGRERPTRAAAAKPVKAKRSRKNAKSAATVDSDADGSDGGKPKRKGGFTKEYTLRCAGPRLLKTHSHHLPSVNPSLPFSR